MKFWIASPIAMLLFALPLAASADTVMDEAASSVKNLHAVTPGLMYRGAHPGDAGIAALAKAGIRTIVDLQGGEASSNAGESEADRLEEKNIAEANGMTFFNVPLSSLMVDFDDQDEKINTALNLISDPANQPVFFHCFHGEDRTGVLTALYRVTYQSCSINQAHSEMMADGHNPFLFWIDYFLYRHSNNFMPLPGRASACPLN